MVEDLRDRANALRALAMDAVESASSGHPGMPMGFADVASVLWFKFLRYDSGAGDWADRDRFVLSAGHGSMLLYGLLYLSGYEDVSLSEIKSFRRLGSVCAGHPEYGHALGIETTTGPLGQGLSNAVGMAIAERSLNAEFGDSLVDHRTYCVVGDGCLMEGISQEAISLAGHLGLSKLVVLFDSNGISIDGSVDLADSTDQLRRFAASGWHCLSCDGHDFVDIERALSESQQSDKPVFIECRTTIGYGSPHKSGSASSHGSPLGADEIVETRAALGWSSAPFEVPESILASWRAAGRRGESLRCEWQERLADHPRRQQFLARLSGEFPPSYEVALGDFKQAIIRDKPHQATRVSSQKALEVLTEHVPAMLGGSADLTGSNNTKTPSLEAMTRVNYGGRYIHYGIRELGMSGVMNGLAVHGGFIAYGGTFLVFSDYARSAIRLSALMGLPVIYVMTHDSIGLGEDGPTHQPIEHLSSLRAIPNLAVFRPADALETAEAWELALQSKSTPFLLALTRQNLPLLRGSFAENESARGGYILRQGEQRQVTLIASGSEVAIAYQAWERLAQQGISACLVSMPCVELFLQQSRAYRDEILGRQPRIIIEAAIAQSWHQFMREQDIFIGMQSFGASAPIDSLYEHFGITADIISEQVKKLLKL